MELDKILYKESSLRNFYNYTIKFPTEEKYILRDFYVVDNPGGIKYFIQFHGRFLIALDEISYKDST
jgi:hypothetical protein